ncbi:hypothetical protein [Psychrobacillus sp. FSL K6-1267]|uniref:hypothetical protein n=1 Tax=Psychrobacillus sp. FSL K6-1267 TaxID=2921543 RepID=UPI0030FB6058
MKKLFTLKRITILSAIMFLCLSSTAYAAKYAYGYSLDVIGYKLQGSNATYFTTNAAKYWNDAVNTRIGPGPTSKNLVAVMDYPDSFLGLYRPSPIVAGGVTQFSISINERTLKAYQIEKYPGQDWNQLAINTTVHEFGHALFLADLDASHLNVSIMSNGRDRFNHVPRKQDINEVKAMRGY